MEVKGIEMLKAMKLNEDEEGNPGVFTGRDKLEKSLGTFTIPHVKNNMKIDLGCVCHFQGLKVFVAVADQALNLLACGMAMPTVRKTIANKHTLN